MATLSGTVVVAAVRDRAVHLADQRDFQRRLRLPLLCDHRFTSAR